MKTEKVEVKGHIIDSLVLPKILDAILQVRGAGFEIEELRVGTRKQDASYARLQVRAGSQRSLGEILSRIEQLGAQRVSPGEALVRRAPRDGVLPEGFYSTTNLPTAVHVGGKWLTVEPTEMDCAIAVRRMRGGRLKARTLAMSDVRKGERIVCGRAGVRVETFQRARRREVFQFMTSSVSSEKPKTRLIHELAAEIVETKRAGLKVLFVAGPAVIHTGAGPYLEQIIRDGFVDVLFAGNGFATHDIESALFGTSLGVPLAGQGPAHGGHDHHMRAINRVRALGGIRQAVRRGALRSGVMHACVRKGVRFVLAGSVRDDGPLPDVVTDMVEVQRRMRKEIPGVGIALMVASTLHAIATGNLLPARVKTVCVDINPAVVTKLTDRGTFQSVGLVTDSESFLRELSRSLHASRR